MVRADSRQLRERRYQLGSAELKREKFKHRENAGTDRSNLNRIHFWLFEPYLNFVTLYATRPRQYQISYIYQILLDNTETFLNQIPCAQCGRAFGEQLRACIPVAKKSIYPLDRYMNEQR